MRTLRVLGFVALLLAPACTQQRAGAGDAGGGGGGDGAPTDVGDRPDWNLPDLGFRACEVARAGADAVPVTLVLQLDTSGSMNCAANDRSCLTGDPTPAPDDSRWDVLRTRLGDALAGLPDTDRAGLMHFPVTFGCPSTTPDVPIAPLSTSRAAITGAAAGLVPMGITPTHDAVADALVVLRADAAPHRSLVLATDGAATVCLGCDAGCSFSALDADNAQLVRDVAAAAAEGITTYVIGVPGSQSYRATLSQLARAGGTAPAGCSDTGPTYCHFDLTDPSLDFSTGLATALGAIADDVVSCDYTIPPNPMGTFDPTRVNVVIVDDAGGETSVPRDPSGAAGWDYDASMTHVLLQGAACDQAHAPSTARVEVRFGCPTVVI